MSPSTKKTAGSIVGGCGCLFLLAVSAWMCFLVYVGLQGRGNDEEASLILGAITCAVATPVLILTIVGLVFAFRKATPEQS